ncbi:MAG: hypothetical protein IKU25_06895 [Clostridia bacterium]|nr:hypothetical protein [Clostridia bacterium]
MKSSFKIAQSVFIALICCICFTFNVSAFDITTTVENPQIVIDGYDNEGAWIDAERVVLSSGSFGVNDALIGSLHYQNKIYGMVLFDDVIADDANLVVKINFRYKKNNIYIVFAPKDNVVLCSENSYLLADGASSKNEKGYCVEFAITAEYDVFNKGDFIQFEISYGMMSGITDYENMYGFSFSKTYDCYVDGQLHENPSHSGSSSNKKPSSSNNSKDDENDDIKPTTATSITQSETAFIDPHSRTIYENEILMTVMMSITIVAVVISLCFRRRLKKDDNLPYDEDDKECD